MLATIRDDTWNMLNMQHITPNSKRWDYSDIPGGCHKKITWLNVATTLEKSPTPTHTPLRKVTLLVETRILRKKNLVCTKAADTLTPCVTQTEIIY